MKKIIFTSAVLLLFCLVNFAQAQTLDDVLKKHFKAVGQENIKTKDSYTISAIVEQMGMKIPMVVKMKQPAKFRMEMDLQGQKMIQTYNGNKGWVVAPWMSPEPQELTGDQLEQAIDQADLEGELYNYAQKGKRAELVGKEEVDGEEVYNIKLTTKNDVEKNYYLDAGTYLISKIKSTVDMQGQTVDIEQKMSDYKNEGGIMMAHKIESNSPMGTAIILITDVSFNENLNDSIFEKP